MKTLIFVISYCITVIQVFSINQLLVHELKKEFLQIEDELWKFILSHNDDKNIDTGITIIRNLYDFDQKVKQMPQDILHGMEVVRETKQFLFLYSDLRIIYDMYEKFRLYQLQSLTVSAKYGPSRKQITTSDMVDDILYDEKNNVNSTLIRIFNKLFESNRDSVIWEVFEIVSLDNYSCKYNQPSQQVFYNLYNVIALIDLKGYVMMQFAYLASRLHEKGDYSKSSLVAREQYKERANITMSSLRGSLEITSGKVWMCDPNLQKEGETFVEITRLLQGHIQNEVDLNSRGTCTETCEAYQMTRNYGCYDSSSDYCRKRKPCNGRIMRCKFMESHVRACLPPSSSLRRYEYIEYENIGVMGKKRACSEKNVNSWFRWFVHCSYCMCLCDEQGPLSDRYFSTREVRAETQNNRVVTGLRLIKHNRIIHLQIQEGKLLPYGYIDNSTVRWVPVDDFKITDPGVRSGKDYHTMTYEQRDLLLDELTPHESDHIVTGVGFEFINGYLRFQLHVTPFDFKTGMLAGQNESYRIYGTGGRRKINLYDADIPTKSNESTPDWDSNLYVQFTHTSFKKDVAQTTIPFFDSQPVTTYPQVPLRGAGIYYKGSEGFGGFVAPSIKTYDFSKNMENEFPDPEPRDDTMDFFEIPMN